MNDGGLSLEWTWWGDYQEIATYLQGEPVVQNEGNGNMREWGYGRRGWV